MKYKRQGNLASKSVIKLESPHVGESLIPGIAAIAINLRVSLSDCFSRVLWKDRRHFIAHFHSKHFSRPPESRTKFQQVGVSLKFN